MPIIDGTCVPAMCFRAEFDGTYARLMQGQTSVGKGTRDVSDLYPSLLVDWKKALRKPAEIVCDGCRCHHGPFSAWTAGNPTPLEHFTEAGTEYTIYGQGARVRWWMGTCLPRPTAVKAAAPHGGGKKKRPGRPPQNARGSRAPQRRTPARRARRA
jgi:hypothetical protein